MRFYDFAAELYRQSLYLDALYLSLAVADSGEEGSVRFVAELANGHIRLVNRYFFLVAVYVARVGHIAYLRTNLYRTHAFCRCTVVGVVEVGGVVDKLDGSNAVERQEIMHLLVILVVVFKSLVK